MLSGPDHHFRLNWEVFRTDAPERIASGANYSILVTGYPNPDPRPILSIHRSQLALLVLNAGSVLSSR
jgi:hypothetical protein